MKFYVPGELLERRIEVHLLGVGGTGGELLDGLVRLHTVLLALGHPGGLRVTAWDGDTVSHSNIGRQRFLPMDVGHHKALVSLHRLNLFYGLDWQAHPVHFTVDEDRWRRAWPDLLITCVDTPGVRAAIGRAGREDRTGCLWLDCGNELYDGQVILGHLSRRPGVPLRLPNVYDFYGADLERLALEGPAADEAPSCGLAEAITRQSLAINRMLADLSLSLLFLLLKEGAIEHHGYFVDVKRGVVTPLATDPEGWAFMGYRPECQDPNKPAAVRQ